MSTTLEVTDRNGEPLMIDPWEVEDVLGDERGTLVMSDGALLETLEPAGSLADRVDAARRLWAEEDR